MYNKEIPKYREFNLSKSKHKYCVCIFVINEGERLLNQLSQMKYLADKIDIVIADGGSTDGSTNCDKLAEYNVHTLLIKDDDGKLGTQMRMAFDWAIKNNYNGVVTIDGNGKDSIESIPLFIEKLEEGYGHVQGSRFIKGGHHENTPMSRLIGVKLLHAPLMSFASKFKYTDTTNGFRAYSTEFLTDERVQLFRNIFTGYELHYYLAMQAPLLGYKCIEIPVTRKYPKTGKVPTKISPIRGNINVLSKLFAVVTGKYNPKK